MIKTKPVNHLKAGETLVVTAWDGSQHRFPVSKVEEDASGLVRISVPASRRPLMDGKTIESSPSGVYVLPRRENIEYEAKH